jgi:glycogen debranching enzyme
MAEVFAYNYQAGSVWPHDNAIIAMGFKHYGLSCEAARVALDISVAASHFRLNQLPELYTAFERDDANFPVEYINVPQARAAGSSFMLTQALLGFLRMHRATSCMLTRLFQDGYQT